MVRVVAFGVVVLALACGGAAVGGDEIELIRTPNGGIQPQAAISQNGTIHLVYFRGEPKSGDLFYVSRPVGQSDWSSEVRVNSEAGSARRNGAISHAQLALGADERVHVSWFNMRPPRYFYARSTDDGRSFEEQRNLATKNVDGVEAGASVAADDEGHVAMIWHAGNLAKEDARGVYARVSSNHGQSFEPETRIDDDRGVCACCGLSATWSGDRLYAIYRAATDFVHRDMTLLTSADAGRSFTAERVHEWNIGACPVSTAKMTPGLDGAALMAWETMGQVFWSRSDSERIVEVPGAQKDRRKNPVAVMNPAGRTLVLWGDGPGWRSGGRLEWQLYDPSGKPVGNVGHGADIPEYSVPAALVKPDGTFAVIY